MRPKGSPKTIASEVPKASIPMACEPLFIGARRTTSDEVIDQDRVRNRDAKARDYQNGKIPRNTGQDVA